MLPAGDSQVIALNSVREYWDLLGRYLWPQRSSVALMSILLLTSTAIQITCPRIVRAFIEGATNGTALPELHRLALVFIGISAVAQALRLAADYWTDRVSWIASNALRLDLMDHLLRLDAGFHKAHAPGELIERVDGDVSALGGFLSSMATQFVGSLLFLLGVIAVLFGEDIRLGLAFAAYAGLASILLIRVRGLAGPVLRENREKTAGF